MEPTSLLLNGRYRNAQPIRTDYAAAVATQFQASPHAMPSGPVPVLVPDLAFPPATGLRATWMGHSTTLLEIDGTRILTDPVWSLRASPVQWAGPRRYVEAPVSLAALPRPDAVVISHDHYDHLDRATIRAMAGWETRFLVPLGVRARLVAWGVPAGRITELDWWDRATVGSLEVVAVPARHASGRGLFDKDRTLWCGFAFLGPRHRVYFSGDTGFFPGFRQIGRLGPFDLTLVEIGAYHGAWPDWHLGPEQALAAHRLVEGRALLPIHWGTFKLAAHGWTEPVERLLETVGDDQILVPRPGESVQPDLQPILPIWWPALPWQTAAEAPIIAGGLPLGQE